MNGTLPATVAPSFGALTVTVAPAAGGGATTAEADEVDVAEPPAFDAVTATFMRAPTSSTVKEYADWIAPGVNGVQEPPAESQRSHW
ncbi:MAG: hypothetical protein H0X39_19235 [Actinobacteria bacterium]|nr:hypothetical protein [Actinomycetota bacterium]